jgi:hypothetical protein
MMMLARQRMLCRVAVAQRHRAVSRSTSSSSASGSAPPPMADSTTNPTLAQRLRGHWESGSILIYASWLCLLPFGVEYVLSIRNNHEQAALFEEFERKRRELEYRWDDERKQLLQKEALFECVIRIDTKLDGYKLFDGKVGDVVQVLAEATGPGRLFNLVRGTGSKSHLVGWYATQYLEKVDPPTSKKGWLWY